MDRFAAAFLIPREHLAAEVAGARDGLPPYNEIVRLKHFYGVAAAAILMRLKDIGILSESSISYAFQTYARTWRTAEPLPLDPASECGKLERPTRFERSVYGTNRSIDFSGSSSRSFAPTCAASRVSGPRAGSWRLRSSSTTAHV